MDTAPQPHMAIAEIELLRKACHGKSHIVEFGCGGSTLLFLEDASRRLDSVESDPAWAAQIQAEPIVAAAARDGRFRMHTIDIGPTGDWGRPIDRSKADRWPRYSRNVWRQVEPSAVDLVFIDGRFRVACTLLTLLKARPEVVIAFHDFWTRLAKYAEVLEFLDVAGREGALAILTPRPDIDLNRVKHLRRRYLNDPD